MGCCDDSPRMQVTCGVHNCHYNQNHMCHANGVEVNPMGDGHAQTSDGTCCSTFKHQLG